MGNFISDNQWPKKPPNVFHEVLSYEEILSVLKSSIEDTVQADQVPEDFKSILKDLRANASVQMLISHFANHLHLFSIRKAKERERDNPY